MRTALLVLGAITAAAILFMVTRSPGPHSPPTRLTREQVVSLASAEATNHGYDLKLYRPPDVRYEPYQRDGKWRLAYQKKRGLGNFFVNVDDKLAAVQLMPGE